MIVVGYSQNTQDINNIFIIELLINFPLSEQHESR